MNFTCKDAIDRGGVSSAYYNLMKSFEPGKSTMTREEFEQALHAAPTMVKGRGMNHHIKLIWNSVDAYVNQHYQTLKDDSSKKWLIEWRDFNCPHERVASLLEQRITECKNDLNAAKNNESITKEQKVLIENGLKILDEIKTQSTFKVGDKNLLLEATTRTTSLSLSPEARNEEGMKRYEDLGTALSMHSPNLRQKLGEMMKAFAGIIVSLIPFWRKQSTIDTNLATTKSELKASKESLQKSMKQQLDSMREAEKEGGNDNLFDDNNQEEKPFLPKIDFCLTTGDAIKLR